VFGGDVTLRHAKHGNGVRGGTGTDGEIRRPTWLLASEVFR